jgi:DNA repair protein RadC
MAMHIARSSDAASLFGPEFVGLTLEVLRVAHLDQQRNLIAMRGFRSGNCDSIEFPIRRIVSDALELQTHSLIVAHNHPSGDASPSRADLAATRTLIDATRPLGIAVYDHLIFTDNGWCSLREMGLI